MVTRTPDSGSGTRTVRPGSLRLTVIVPFAIISGICIAIGVYQLVAHQPAEGSFESAFATPAMLYCLNYLLMLRIRLKITQGTVLARQGGWRGHPDLEVPRNAVRAIHYYPRIISFRDLDNEPFMMIDCNYTVRQMKGVAEILGVPLYNHMLWPGLREVDIGRVVYKPRAADRVS